MPYYNVRTTTANRVIGGVKSMSEGINKTQQVIQVFESEIAEKNAHLRKLVEISEVYRKLSEGWKNLGGCVEMFGPFFFFTRESTFGEKLVAKEVCRDAASDHPKVIAMQDAMQMNCPRCEELLPVVLVYSFAHGGTSQLEFDTWYKAFNLYCYKCLHVTYSVHGPKSSQNPF